MTGITNIILSAICAVMICHMTTAQRFRLRGGYGGGGQMIIGNLDSLVPDTSDIYVRQVVGRGINQLGRVNRRQFIRSRGNQFGFNRLGQQINQLGYNQLSAPNTVIVSNDILDNNLNHLINPINGIVGALGGGGFQGGNTVIVTNDGF